MPESDEPRPITAGDLRALAIQLADQVNQLEAALTIEVRTMAARSRTQARTDIDHLAQLALGELRIARQELIERGRTEATGSKLTIQWVERRLTALIVGNVALTLANTALIVVGG